MIMEFMTAVPTQVGLYFKLFKVPGGTHFDVPDKLALKPYAKKIVWELDEGCVVTGWFGLDKHGRLVCHEDFFRDIVFPSGGGTLSLDMKMSIS